MRRIWLVLFVVAALYTAWSSGNGSAGGVARTPAGAVAAPAAVMYYV